LRCAKILLKNENPPKRVKRACGDFWHVLASWHQTCGNRSAEARLKVIFCFARGSIVSLDGSSSELHDKIRGFPGAFQRVKDFATELSNRKISFGFNITVFSENYHDIDNTIKTALNFNPDNISISPVRPSGRGGQLSTDLELLKKIIFAAKKCSQIDPRISIMEPLQQYYFPRENKYTHGCNMNAGVLHISVDGSMKLCTAHDDIIGHVDQLTAEKAEIINSTFTKIQSRSDLIGTCAKCSYKDACGGCRCRAFHSSGSIFGSDPCCPLVEYDTHLN
jgi:radical SAM protein with 4Fe4S-binding SPASM domain